LLPALSSARRIVGTPAVDAVASAAAVVFKNSRLLAATLFDSLFSRGMADLPWKSWLARLAPIIPHPPPAAQSAGREIEHYFCRSRRKE
jgi:hypothetical protein